jgi:hypothetical protein
LSVNAPCPPTYPSLSKNIALEFTDRGRIKENDEEGEFNYGIL